MDLSPFPSLAVPGVPDEPHDMVPHVPPGTEMDLSWEAMTRQWLHRSRLLPDLGRMLWQSRDVPPHHGEWLGQSCAAGDKPRGSTQLLGCRR